GVRLVRRRRRHDRESGVTGKNDGDANTLDPARLAHDGARSSDSQYLSRRREIRAASHALTRRPAPAPEYGAGKFQNSRLRRRKVDRSALRRGLATPHGFEP